MRSIALIAAATTMVALALAAAAGAKDKPSCDRGCLHDVVTQYLSSLVAHAPNKAPLAKNARFTEDTRELPVGGGLWQTASKVRPFRTEFLDVREQTAVVHAVLEEQGMPVLFAARLKIADKQITEIETMVVRNKEEGALFAPDALAAPSPGMNDAPPKRELMSRAKMIELALRYPAGLKVGSFEKSNVPFAPDAYRFENGVRMAGPGCTFQPPSCENMRGQRLPTLSEIKSEVVAVDEENGTVVLRMDFGKGSLPGPESQGKSLVTFEAFKVYGGQVHAVEAVFEGMPPNSPRGWK
jgi:hypothetical protein